MPRLFRTLGSPFVRYFDHRFDEIKQQLRAAEQPSPPAELGAAVVGQLAPALAEITYNTAASAETAAGAAATVDRQLARFLAEQRALQTESGAVLDLLSNLQRDGRNGRYRPEVVQFLNWVFSFDGPIAERSLLMNHPLTVLFDQEGPRLFEVNERIVEIPFVFNATASLPPGSRIIDVGSTESTLALSLASQGHRVVALDPRPYPFRHPNLTVEVGEVEHYTPTERVSMVVAVSAIEHFGLGHYVEGAATVGDDDQRALDRFREWLVPGGSVVLTVPTGRASTDGFQRVYDDERLKRLVDGWSIARVEYARRVDDTAWDVTDALDEEARGVAMLVLE